METVRLNYYDPEDIVDTLTYWYGTHVIVLNDLNEQLFDMYPAAHPQANRVLRVNPIPTTHPSYQQVPQQHLRKVKSLVYATSATAPGTFATVFRMFQNSIATDLTHAQTLQILLQPSIQMMFIHKRYGKPLHSIPSDTQSTNPNDSLYPLDTTLEPLTPDEASQPEAVLTDEHMRLHLREGRINWHIRRVLDPDLTDGQQLASMKEVSKIKGDYSDTILQQNIVTTEAQATRIIFGDGSFVPDKLLASPPVQEPEPPTIDVTPTPPQPQEKEAWLS